MVQNHRHARDDQRRQHRRRFSKHRVRDAFLVVALGISVGARENNAPEAGANRESAPGSFAKSEVSDETHAVALWSGEFYGVFVGAERVETIDVVFVNHDWGVSYFSVLRVSEDVADSGVYVFGDVFRVEKRRRARIIHRFVVVSSGAGDARDGGVLFEADRRGEDGESRRVRGVVDGVCVLRAHRGDVFMGDV